MSILELLSIASAASSVVITEADAEAIKEKISKVEDEFAKESLSSSIDDALLSKTYSL
ncbi:MULTISPECIES: hypothetical protein [Enterobacterales]|jgi:hypothetical protein|uniref:hypothetical protein n=1 Tax=Enterobacterales TaxID=91347 RepID=UPI0009D57031|nr:MULTISPECIES: hypothetical protein [Enterobacterales]EKZ5285285.1 hypothetical protein [Klebsiella aerogenes]EIX9176211.1 hypothetical protein [Klebsiella pneumoniae]MCJ6256315.1 hypothetical protein [Klebsiella pneumoniae]MCZ5055190.1 hypothetical protein [Klebsiella pneumoniae]NRN16151.1 hypothetical protein [Serratia marcescens]